jgi:hypothetical protein
LKYLTPQVSKGYLQALFFDALVVMGFYSLTGSSSPFSDRGLVQQAWNTVSSQLELSSADDSDPVKQQK